MRIPGGILIFTIWQWNFQESLAYAIPPKRFWKIVGYRRARNARPYKIHRKDSGEFVGGDAHIAPQFSGL